jgi:hypothetical protein
MERSQAISTISKRPEWPKPNRYTTVGPWGALRNSPSAARKEIAAKLRSCLMIRVYEMGWKQMSAQFNARRQLPTW